MAKNDEIGRARVELDTASAEAKIKSLDAKMQELKQTKKELEAGNNLVGMGMVDREIKSTQKDLNQLRQQTKDYSTVLNNLSVAPLRTMEAAYAQLRKEVKGATRDTDEYKEKTAQLQTLGAEIKKVKNEQAGVEKPGIWGSMADGVNKYAGMIAIAAASFTGFALGVKGAIEAADDYEEKIANLSALTGLTGEKLKWLSDQAKEMSTSTVKGNIRITKSADDIAEAFTTVGSKRPELLGNKDALKQVTEEALILAEAGKMETAPAIEGVTASMNQFNLGADQSSRIINTLAAGSLEGSAEISDLASSMKNVGTVAKDSNMSLEQTTAALEVLASKQILGEEAGTKLRGALLKMKEAGVGYASGQFNLRDAIDDVNKKLAAHGSQLEKDAILQKTFGAENITTGSILLQNADEYDRLTKAVTGTNVAYTQAHTNTDIAKAKLAQAANQFHNTTIEIGEKLNPAMAKSVNIVNMLLRVIVDAPKFIAKWGYSITSILVVMGLLVIAINAEIIAKKALAVWNAITLFWNNVLKASFIQLWITMMANPIFAILSGITLLIAAIIDLTRRAEEAAAAQRAHRKEIEETKKAIDDLVKKGSSIDNMDSSHIDAYIDELSKKVVLLRHRQVDAINAARAAEAGQQRNALGSKMKDDSGYGYGEAIAKVKELTALLEKAKARKKELVSAEKKSTTSTTGGDSDNAYTEAINEAARNADIQRLFAKDMRLAKIMDKKQYLKESRKIDLDELEAKKAIMIKFGKDTIDIDKQMYERKFQLQEEDYNNALAGATEAADKQRTEATNARLSGLMDETEYRQKLRAIDRAEVEARRQIMVNAKKNEAADDKQYSETKLKNLEADINEEVKLKNEGFDKEEQQAAKDRFDYLLTEEKYQDKLFNITIRRLKAELELRKKAGEDTKALEKQLAAAELKQANTLANRKKEILKKQLEDNANYLSLVNRNSKDSVAGIQFDAQNQRDLVQKELDNQIIDENEAALRRAEITNTEWQSKADLVFQYQGQISTLVDQAAQGQIKSFEDFGAQIFIMYLDFIEKELTAAMYKSIGMATLGSMTSAESIATWGLAGVAKAAALTVLIKGAFSVAKAGISRSMGYAEGGYTAPGPKYKPAGIVHAGEWVASQRLLRNPIAASMVSQLNAWQERGYAQGGYVTPTTQALPAAKSDPEMKRILAANAQAIIQLSSKLNNLQAKISYTHLKTETDKMSAVESSRKTG